MATLIAELVGFVVIVAVLYRYVRPLVQQMVRDRQDTVQQQVDASEEASRRLAEAHRRFETAEAEARKEVARIRDDARADASRIREELQEQADREMERVRQRGEDQLVAQRDQMTRMLRAEIGGQSVRLARQIVVDLLADDTRRSATVDNVLADLENMTRPAGGRSDAPAPSGDAQLTTSGGGGN